MTRSKPNGLSHEVKLLDRRVSSIEKFVVAQHEYNVSREKFEGGMSEEMIQIKTTLADLKTQGDERKGGDAALTKLANQIITTVKLTGGILVIAGVLFGALMWILRHA